MLIFLIPNMFFFQKRNETDTLLEKQRAKPHCHREGMKDRNINILFISIPGFQGYRFVSHTFNFTVPDSKWWNLWS